MSKFGWSYPAGVTESMLPGNSPEEQRAEALADKLFDILEPLKTEESDANERTREDIVLKLMEVIDAAYAEGYASAQSDNASAEEHMRS